MDGFLKYEIIGGSKNSKISVSPLEKNGVLTYLLDLTLNNEIPEPLTVKIFLTATNSLAVWSPFDRVHIIRPDWGKTEINSRLASGMPIQQVIGFDGNNKMCLAVSDVDTPLKIRIGYCEETAELISEIEFFTLPTSARTNYKAEIRVDLRDIKYYDSIYDTVNWWENDCGYKSAYVPESANEPVDSLWYSFHQQLDYDTIIAECKNSKAIGLETVIIDDGWQTEDNNRGYAFCGDWQEAKSKMKDMKGLVNEIHSLGMKVMLWFSVPFMGVNSKHFKEFEKMLLDESGDNKTFFALDPRYKKVREYLSALFEKSVVEWNLDGLKLDFIDSFVLKGNSLKKDEARDTESLEEAIHFLMSETKNRLTKQNSDILIEFRQSYIGPAIRKYGNMLRVGDCPGDVITNRSQIINLRFTSGKTAVHSDMLMWNVDDTVENSAQQIINSLFAVPQISMLINKLPSEQKAMIDFYIKLWKENKCLLLNGKLTAENPQSEYTSARTTLNNSEFIVSYSDNFIEILKSKAVLVNGTKDSFFVLKNVGGYNVKVKNCLGETILENTLKTDLEFVNVPRAGVIFLDK